MNRAYLQFIAAGQGSPAGMDSETAVTSTLLPSSLKLYLDTISAFMAPLSGSSDPDAIYNATLSQWAACGPVELVQGLYDLPTPFLKDSGLAPLTYHPEFCQFIVETLQAMYPGVTVAPSALSSFGKYRCSPRSSLSPLLLTPSLTRAPRSPRSPGVGLSVDAARAFLDLAVGTSNMTFQDPMAQQFLYLFLLSPQGDVLQHLSAASVPQTQALSTVDANTWALLQGYVLRTMTTGGKVGIDLDVRRSTIDVRRLTIDDRRSTFDVRQCAKMNPTLTRE